jgi:WD40 repeat protein
MSQAFSVAVSGGQDGNCILWDHNTFCYIRTIAEHEAPVKLVTISETLGDVVSVCDSNDSEGSVLRVHTINGSLITHFTTPLEVTAICYSSAQEGVSVNVLVTGFANGTIKFWSSWDLTPVRELRADRFDRPIQCITFSADNHHLYVINSEGSIVIWGKSQGKRSSLGFNSITLF